MQTTPRARGEATLTVSRLLSGNSAQIVAGRVVYSASYVGKADQQGRFCGTIDGHYIPAHIAVADLRVTIQASVQRRVYEARFLLVHGQAELQRAVSAH